VTAALRARTTASNLVLGHAPVSLEGVEFGDARPQADPVSARVPRDHRLTGTAGRTMLAEARVAQPSRRLPIDGHRTSAQSDGRLLVENLVRSRPMRTRSD
jgi:hypothetical protein